MSIPIRFEHRYLVPAGLTQANLLAGFIAISVLTGIFPWELPAPDLPLAGCCVLIAMLFDCADGWFARRLHAESDVGAHLDAGADLVSFGLAPAIMIVVATRDAFPHVGWLVGATFAVCTAVRLARFQATTVLPDEDRPSGHGFQGLPSPAAAGLIVGCVAVISEQGDGLSQIVVLGFALAAFVTAGLMVGPLPYPHPMRHPATSAAALLVTVVGLWIFGPPALLALFVTYALVPFWTRPTPAADSLPL